jgi:DNA-binding CsgD family transcriptional regulator
MHLGNGHVPGRGRVVRRWSPPSSGERREILAEVSGLAQAPGQLSERAEALLAQVQRVVPFDAGALALLLPGQREHVALSRYGFDERTDSYYDGPGFLQDVELAGLQRSRVARRLVDLGVPPAEIPLWGEYLLPAGFQEGFGMGLFTPDGRYLGLLGVVTERATPMTVEAVNLLGLLAPKIASAVDPLRLLSTIAQWVHDAIAGVVLTPFGMALPLPGLPGHPLLTPGAGVPAAAVAQLAHGTVHTSFLAPDPAADDTNTHLRVTGLAVPPDLRFFASVIVLLSPPGDLHGLSNRELQVLGLLVTGASNEQIAWTLGITTRTVEVHVEHVRAKLAATSRTTAAARALRLGLFVPPSVVTDRHGTGHD